MTLIFISVLSLFLIIFGLIVLVDESIWREMTERKNRQQGITNSTKTDEWQQSRKLSGVAMVIFGLLLGGFTWYFLG